VGREGRIGRLPKHVKAYTIGDRPYFYFRLGEAVRLPGLPWSPEFMAAHEAALKAWRGQAPAIGASRTMTGTVDAAIVAYYKSPLFAELAVATRGPARALIERFRAEVGSLKLRGLGRREVQAYIASLKSPSVQRNMLRALRHLCRFAAAAGLLEQDPTEGVTRAKMKDTGGFHTWTEEDAAAFEARHKVGSMARLAFELYLNLGVRKSDVVRIGPPYVRDGVLHNFLPKKTSTTGGKRISVKLFEQTKAAIAATPVTSTETYLVTSNGQPWSANGFGNKMRQWCDEAGLPDCTSHGLRKLFMVRLVHAGYTAPQIGALSGHKDLREIQRYIEEYDRQKVGIETSTRFEAVRNANAALSKSPGRLDNRRNK
jgi:integrase